MYIIAYMDPVLKFMHSETEFFYVVMYGNGCCCLY